MKNVEINMKGALFNYTIGATAGFTLGSYLTRALYQDVDDAIETLESNRRYHRRQEQLFINHLPTHDRHSLLADAYKEAIDIEEQKKKSVWSLWTSPIVDYNRLEKEASEIWLLQQK